MPLPKVVSQWSHANVNSFLISVGMEEEELRQAKERAKESSLTGFHVAKCSDPEVAMAMFGVSKQTAEKIASRIAIWLNSGAARTTAKVTYLVKPKISVDSILELQRDDGSWVPDERLAEACGISISKFNTLLHDVEKIKLKQGVQDPMQQSEEKALATKVAVQLVEQGIEERNSASRALKSEESEDVHLTPKALQELPSPSASASASQMLTLGEWKHKADQFLGENPVPETWEEPVKDLITFISTPQEIKYCSQCKQEYSAQRSKCPNCIANSAPPLPEKEEDDEDHYKFDFIHSRGADITKPIQWEGLKGMHRIPGGPGSVSGVFLIDTEEGVYVLKFGNLNCASEYYCSLLSQKLQIHSPKVIMVSQDEFTEIKEHAKDCPFAPRDEEKGVLFVQKILPMMMMEYISGNVLVGLDHLKYLSNERMLKEIGRIIAFDVLVNNYDRLPLVWDNEGNPGNLIFEREEKGREPQVYSIDQILFSITDEDGVKQYVGKVRDALEEAKAKKIGEHIVKVRGCIKRNTGYELSDEECNLIQEGLLEGVRNTLAQLGSNPGEALRGLKEKTVADFRAKGYDIEAEFETIRVEFMEQMTSLFAEFA